MQPKETALIAMRLMTEGELECFVRGTPEERTAIASEAIDRYAASLKSALDDPDWTTAARHASLSVLLRTSTTSVNLRAA